MAKPFFLLSTVTAFSLGLMALVSGEEQCNGGAPMSSVSTFLNMSVDYSVSDRICCHNHRYAERKGYLAEDEVDLFSRLDPNEEIVFYDSVCGIPLFVAPRGRQFEEFREESLHHGWPSFRPEEIISENVIIHSNGRMESKCGTHLGHNLPNGGVDRYCIDLVCIAGSPSDSNSSEHSVPEDKSILTVGEFDASSYKSSAKKLSGNSQKISLMGVMIICVGSIVGACIAFMSGMRVWRSSENQKRTKHTGSQTSETEDGDKEGEEEGDDEVTSMCSKVA